MNKVSSPSPEDIKAKTIDILQKSEIFLPADVKVALLHAKENETNPVAKGEFENILKNIEIAEKELTPICQDTGIPVIYLTLPYGMAFTKEMEEAILSGVREATVMVPLRPNVVNPLTRQNSGDNTGWDLPPIHIKYDIIDKMRITVLPKGAGSENVSALYMLTPGQVKDIDKYILKAVLNAGSRPCPPIIAGIGIGGTADGALSLAKEALLSPIDSMTIEETEICKKINKLGIGPMGLGGKTTCLAVKIKTAGCHTASLPLAINIQCWACRRETVEV